MIIADKIIRHRKKNGWSQEELAEKMNVSRQAVSKWESSQSVPDVDKILMLGELFGVTTDYLLKDDLGEEKSADSFDKSLKRLTVSEVKEYLDFRKSASVKIAAATFICIISPLPMFILGVCSETGQFGISENFAGAAGIIALLILVALACAMFIPCGVRNEQWEFLEKTEFDIEHAARSIVSDRKKLLSPMYARFNIVGTVLCVLSPIPLLCGAFMENEMLLVIMLCCTMIVAGIGTAFFIIAGVQWSAVQRLMKENRVKEKSSALKSAVSTSYWLIVTAIYFLCSFISNDWHVTWVIWAVAGVLFGVVMSIYNIVCLNKDEKEK